VNKTILKPFIATAVGHKQF